MRSKQAYFLLKGDNIREGKEKWKVEAVFRVQPDERMVNVRARHAIEGKRVFHYYWTEQVPLWVVKEQKRMRYAFLIWLGNKLGSPVIRKP
jgi:hypothetical protein